MSLFSRTRDSVACMVDDRFIRFFHVARDGKDVVVKNYFSERIPDHLFDEQRRFYPDDALIARLTQTRKRHKFEKIHMVIPDRYITVFHTVVPRGVFASEKSLRIAIERHLENLLVDHPEFSPTDMIEDYEVIEETPDGIEVHVSVARPDRFAHIPKLLEAAGFVIDEIDIASSAVNRIVRDLSATPSYGTISVGTHTTEVSIVSSGKIIASSWCHVGSDDLITTIQNTLAISRTEAERIIREYGILHVHPDKNVLAALFMTIKPVVEAIHRVQATATKNVYKHSFYHVRPDVFYIYGIGAGINGIPQYLGIKSGAIARVIDLIPAETLDEAAMIQIPVEILPAYLPVISAAVHFLAE